MNQQQVVSLVIVDLDNTLWDWVHIWGTSFNVLLSKLSADSGIDIEQLKREFKQIHEKHGTSEYSFSVEELPSLQAKHRGGDLRAIYDAAITAYRAQRAATLRLYPDVLETLQTLKDAGVLLIGYTESMAYYTAYRLRETGLDRVLDYLYSSPDHDLPENMDEDKKARYKSSVELRRTVHRHTPRGELKPSARILTDIIAAVGADKARTIYVGDSKMKDVVMAQSASVTDVWAEYGKAQGTPEYDLLKDVTHWTKEMVAKEAAINAGAQQIHPTHVLPHTFGALLSMFTFMPFKHPDRRDAALVIDIWKKVVDVQQHFNDIEMRIRNFAITLLVGVLSLAFFVVKENITADVYGQRIPVGSVIALAGALAWQMFYLMDQYWYHKFLKAAGVQAGFIETRWAGALPELGLSTRISQASCFPLPPWRWLQRIPLPWGLKWGPETSTDRLRLFYHVGFYIHLGAAVMAWSAHTTPQHAAPTTPMAQITVPVTVVPVAPPNALAPQPPPAPKTEQKKEPEPSKTTPASAAKKGRGAP